MKKIYLWMCAQKWLFLGMPYFDVCKDKASKSTQKGCQWLLDNSPRESRFIFIMNGSPSDDDQDVLYNFAANKLKVASLNDRIQKVQKPCIHHL